MPNPPTMKKSLKFFTTMFCILSFGLATTFAQTSTDAQSPKKECKKECKEKPKCNPADSTKGKCSKSGKKECCKMK